MGYLKKYKKRGYIIDPRNPVVNIKYKKIVPDFGNQYSDYIEDEDTRFPPPLMKKLSTNIFIKSNYGHDQTGITKFQSIIGVCQWISTSGRFEITFAVANLNRSAHCPREGHLKRAEKILGYLKKYKKRGYIIDPRDPVVNIKYEKIVPDFGNQYSDFIEDEDTRLPPPLMKELSTNIFIDSNHGHDQVTGRSITGMISFVGRTPVTNASKRQSAVQTSTFGAEFIALKRMSKKQ